MSAATTIPILPCISLDQTLTFYRTLGFAVTHEQTRPNVYAATQRDDIHLHFMGLPQLDPSRSYSACLVLVPALEPLYAAFSAGLRGLYGKLPVRGEPRISRLRPGASRFTLVDVAGNSLIFIRRGAADDYEDSIHAPTSATRLGKALHQARRYRDFRNDDRAAAKVLDAALAHHDAGSPLDRARALAARAELAWVLGDRARAEALDQALLALTTALTDEQREHHREELEAPARSRKLQTD